MRRNRWIFALAALVGSGPGCSPGVEIEDLPPARVTVDSVARRLGRLRAPGDLTEIAARTDRVLPLLTSRERSALARGAVRFRVDRPAVVTVVAAGELFWLRDLGFVATGDRLRNEDGEFAAYRKTVEAGPVGLGVNALDHSSRSHYAVFLRAADGRPGLAENRGDRPLRGVPRSVARRGKGQAPSSTPTGLSTGSRPGLVGDDHAPHGPRGSRHDGRDRSRTGLEDPPTF